MANYVLWGKDRKTGLNAKQDGSVPLSTKNGDWDDRDTRCESLDGLMEQATFSETQLSPLTAPQTKVKREVFSREKELARCPDYIKPTLIDLWRQIDELDLGIGLWEEAHGRRDTPPRKELVGKFGAEEIAAIQEATTHWGQFLYLKKRHQLVELRRQQYTLRDSYVEPKQVRGTSGAQMAAPDPMMDEDIEVLPLGAWNKSVAAALVFQSIEKLVPDNFGEEELRLISELYWEKKNYTAAPTTFFVDFREPEHVYEMLQAFWDLDKEKNNTEKLEDGAGYLVRALKYYIAAADLTEVQREVLRQKMNKVKNVDIAATINKQFGKSYTTNYISTIFRQRIIPKINEAARNHEEVISQIFFPEEFKQCNCCKKVLLKSSTNFMKKARSADGFANKCKKCDKASRQGGKYEAS